MKTESPRAQLDALGDYIRTQRKSAELSLRELAEKTGVSNPYLSQLERGLHEPSMRVLSAIADALEVSIETLLRSAGLLRGEEDGAIDGIPSTPAAIAADHLLTEDQRAALLAVYRSYVEGNRASGVLDDLDSDAEGAEGGDRHDVVQDDKEGDKNPGGSDADEAPVKARAKSKPKPKSKKKD